MPTYGNRWPVYAKQWDGMTLKQTRLSTINSTAKRLVAAKARYQAVEKVTGVPWWWIAATHEREASQSWSASLAQGDPWNRVSTHVPRGRGPFPSWEAAAIDALKIDGVSNVKDWRLEKALFYWEAFNGWGYYSHGIPSPYVWGATSVQKPGKYVADGVWSLAVDQQLGTAAMLKAMMALDPSIKPIRENAAVGPLDPAPEDPPQEVTFTGVKWVQDTLNKVMVPSPALVVDGSYGTKTRAAVREFQATHSLAADGIVGGATTVALDAALASLKPAPAPTGLWARVKGWFA